MTNEALSTLGVGSAPSSRSSACLYSYRRRGLAQPLYSEPISRPPVLVFPFCGETGRGCSSGAASIFPAGIFAQPEMPSVVGASAICSLRATPEIQTLLGSPPQLPSKSLRRTDREGCPFNEMGNRNSAKYSEVKQRGETSINEILPY